MPETLGNPVELTPAMLARAGLAAAGTRPLDRVGERLLGALRVDVAGPAGVRGHRLTLPPPHPPPPPPASLPVRGRRALRPLTPGGGHGRVLGRLLYPQRDPGGDFCARSLIQLLGTVLGG